MQWGCLSLVFLIFLAVDLPFHLTSVASPVWSKQNVQFSIISNNYTPLIRSLHDAESRKIVSQDQLALIFSKLNDTVRTINVHAKIYGCH